MSNPHFRVGYLLIVCLLLSFLSGASVRAAQPEKQVDRLAKAYRAARTEFERRAVCLEAIDSGVIGELRPVAVVDAIFGTSYARKLPRGKELESGFVEFHPLPPPPRDDIQAGHVGWYFVFKYDSAGHLVTYYLSNLQK